MINRRKQNQSRFFFLQVRRQHDELIILIIIYRNQPVRQQQPYIEKHRVNDQLDRSKRTKKFNLLLFFFFSLRTFITHISSSKQWNQFSTYTLWFNWTRCHKFSKNKSIANAWLVRCVTSWNRSVEIFFSSSFFSSIRCIFIQITNDHRRSTL